MPTASLCHHLQVSCQLFTTVVAFSIHFKSRDVTFLMLFQSECFNFFCCTAHRTSESFVRQFRQLLLLLCSVRMNFFANRFMWLEGILFGLAVFGSLIHHICTRTDTNWRLPLCERDFQCRMFSFILSVWFFEWEDMISHFFKAWLATIHTCWPRALFAACLSVM